MFLRSRQDSETNHTAKCWSVRGHLLFYKTSGRQWSSLASRWVLTLHHFWESGNRVRLSVLDLWEVPSVSPAQVQKVLERHRGLSGTLIQHLLESLCKEEIKSGLKLIFKVCFYSIICCCIFYEFEKTIGARVAMRSQIVLNSHFQTVLDLLRPQNSVLSLSSSSKICGAHGHIGIA